MKCFEYYIIEFEFYVKKIGKLLKDFQKEWSLIRFLGIGLVYFGSIIDYRLEGGQQLSYGSK